MSCATACVDTGQQPVTVSLYGQGTAASEPIAGKSDWTIELARADVAFGPLYVCAGVQAGKYCDTANLEWLESVVLDALDDEEREIGRLSGVTGKVRSWMCDLGITSLLTQEQPTALEAAEDLGGNSVVLAGVAQKDLHTITFTLQIPVEAGAGAEKGVSIMASYSKDPFAHDVASDDEVLTVRFDPRPWVAAIDFESLVRGRECESSGCALDVILDRESPAGAAVRTAILAGQRPTFSWGSRP